MKQFKSKNPYVFYRAFYYDNRNRPLRKIEPRRISSQFHPLHHDLCVGHRDGKSTILFHIVLVLIQIVLLRKNFKPVQLLQVLVGIVFGYFTTIL